ncbi:zf-CCHC domain-containing protein [Tanacetum coccineum]
MAFYKFTIHDDLNMEQVDQNDNSQEHSLFRTRCVIHQKIFDVVIDYDSPKIFVSRDVVQHLKMPIETIPKTYTIRWENSSSEIMVSEVCKIPFSIGKYKDEMMYDIVEMDACHIILGKSWVHDLKATYNDTIKTPTCFGSIELKRF